MIKPLTLSQRLLERADASDEDCRTDDGDIMREADEALKAAAKEMALAVERERLRFEGDLDKWMKIIGAGITGFQPEAYALMDLACEALKAKDAEIAKLRSAMEARWQPMDTAPLDGKHCILSMQVGGGFIYSVQGAFMQGTWMNAADIKAEPLAWMPNVLLPEELCPWTDAFKARNSNKEKADA